LVQNTVNHSVKTINWERALSGCLLGTAVGDALGLSYEGLSARRAQAMFPDLARYHFLAHYGMCSDDTEHQCMVAQALLAAQHDVKRFQRDFAWRLRAWFLGLPAGIGWATLRAIIRLCVGFSPEHSGVYSAGNGPAMRSAIIGVCYGHDKPLLRQFIRANTRITHTDPQAEYAALAVAMAAWQAATLPQPNPAALLAELEPYIDSEATLWPLLQCMAKSVANGESTTTFSLSLGLEKGVTGFANHSVPVCLHAWLSQPHDYEAAVLAVIRCGGDTDTTAAIVGSIVGAAVGVGGIPEPWQADLWEYPRSRHWLQQLAQRLAQHCAGEAQQPLPLFWPAIIPRNVLFMFLVLGHGFRRLLPPY